jgi:hypothetical protein
LAAEVYCIAEHQLRTSPRVQSDDQKALAVEPLAARGHRLWGQKQVAHAEDAARDHSAKEGQGQHVPADEPHHQRIGDEDHHPRQRHQSPEGLRVFCCEGLHAVPKSRDRKS